MLVKRFSVGEGSQLLEYSESILVKNFVVIWSKYKNVLSSFVCFSATLSFSCLWWLSPFFSTFWTILMPLGFARSGLKTDLLSFQQLLFYNSWTFLKKQFLIRLDVMHKILWPKLYRHCNTNLVTNFMPWTFKLILLGQRKFVKLFVEQFKAYVIAPQIKITFSESCCVCWLISTTGLFSW